MITTPSRDELIALREKGMTREDIAEHYDVSLTTIRRWIREHNIPRPSRGAQKQRNKYLTRSGEIIAPVEDDMTSMEKASIILGDRLTERRGAGYYLDGRPANISKIFEAAGLEN